MHGCPGLSRPDGSGVCGDWSAAVATPWQNAAHVAANARQGATDKDKAKRCGEDWYVMFTIFKFYLELQPSFWNFGGSSVIGSEVEPRCLS